MYNWFKEQFDNDKQCIIDNNLEYLYCTFDGIEEKLNKLKNMDVNKLTKEEIEDTKYLYNVISDKGVNEGLYQHYNRVINWYHLNIDMTIASVEKMDWKQKKYYRRSNYERNIF